MPCCRVLIVAILMLSGLGSALADTLRIEQIIACRNDATAVAVGVNTVWTGSRNGILEFERKSGRLIGEYGIPEGLTDPQVGGLATDGKGHLWVGTPSGLFEASGQGRFTAVPGKGEPVTAVGYGAGALWVGFVGSLHRWDGRGWERVDAFQRRVPTKVVATSSGEVWVMSADLLARVAGGPPLEVSPPAEWPVLRDAWIAGSRVFIQMSRKPQDEPNFVASPLFELRDGKLSALAAPGAYWDFPMSVDESGRVWIRHLWLDRDDRPHPAGLSLTTGGKDLARVEGLPDPAVNAVHRAADGTVWVMTARGTAACTKDGRIVRHYASSVGPASPSVNMLRFGGRLQAFLSEDGSASIFDGKTWTHVPMDRRISAAVTGRAGQLLVFGYTLENERRMPEGFFVLEARRWRRADKLHDLVNRAGLMVEDGSAGPGAAVFLGTQLWSDTYVSRIVYYDGGRWWTREVSVPKKVGKGIVFQRLAVGPRGALALVGYVHLLALWDGRAWRFEKMPVKEGPPPMVGMDADANVWVLFDRDGLHRRGAGGAWEKVPGSYARLGRAPDGSIWAIGRDPLTVVRLGRDRRSYAVEAGALRDAGVLDMQFDDAGRLWLSTTRGVWKMSPLK